MPAATSTSTRTDSAAATRALARAIGDRLSGGEFLCLSGPLGAGKTTFAKGIAEGLGIDPRDVTSPTFLLVHVLSGRRTLVHLDAYRVASAEEFRELDVDGLAAGGVVLLEWPERVPEFLPPDRLEVELSPGAEEEERAVVLRATGPVHARLLPEEAGG